MTYHIAPVSAASPDMPSDQYVELREDIRLHGQLVPIWRCGAEIIDGRKRFRACGELGIEAKFVDLSSDQDPEAVSRSLNILRTHYTPSQRAMYAAKRATATKAEGGRRKHGSTSPNLVMQKTASEAARESGVAESAVIQAKAIRRAAAPEVVAAVEAGKLTLHAAEQIVKHAPATEQAAATAKVIEASKGKARQTPVSALGRSLGIKRSPKRPAEWRAERAFDQLDNALDAIEGLFAEAGRGVAGAWLDKVAAARGRLAAILRSHKKGA